MTQIKTNIKEYPSLEGNQNKVLVAPLNWGLGHATRSVPIIRLLLENNFTPVIASDGIALTYLKNEFPQLQTVELPSYNIRYAKHAFLTKWKLFFSVFSILSAVKKEQKIIAELVETNTFCGIVSDNRFGVRNSKIPSVYITHQLKVFSGFTTFLTTYIHKRIFSKYDVCWVPDATSGLKLAGDLSVSKPNNFKVTYLGNLSPLKFKNVQNKYDVTIVLSGPEPQRSILERKLILKFSKYKGRVLLIRGDVQHRKVMEQREGIEIVNFLNSFELEEVLNSSDLIVARSGYSTVMDLAKLRKKAFFIPTPGQPEQEYLAAYLEQIKIAPFVIQEQFDINCLSKVSGYKGFKEASESKLNASLLEVFKSV